jgi:hypothetical protein
VTPVNLRLTVQVASATALLVALALFFVFYERPVPAPKAAAKPPLVAESMGASEPAPLAHTVAAAKEPPVEPLPAASSSVQPALPALDETSLMAKLRELRGSNPELTLNLAREAQARFKNSPDAAEQSWFVVKSLTDLGRHDEARVEGKKLVKGYPGTRWAEDAHRHLFVNPATHPAERGYGKDLDL